MNYGAKCTDGCRSSKCQRLRAPPTIDDNNASHCDNFGALVGQQLGPSPFFKWKPRSVLFRRRAASSWGSLCPQVSHKTTFFEVFWLVFPPNQIASHAVVERFIKGEQNATLGYSSFNCRTLIVDIFQNFIAVCGLNE